jgi:hypothetical protein
VTELVREPPRPATAGRLRAEAGGELLTPSPAFDRRLQLALVLLIAVTAILRLRLVVASNVNWDEFYYLAQVYAYRRGVLSNALQTIHVHWFSWLPRVGGNEVDQVVAARGVYYALALGSCGFIYAIARRFVTRTAALFPVLCYLSYAEIVAHGTSFRADGLSVFFLLAALFFVLRQPSRRDALPLAMAAVCTALALLVTIKTIFMLPTLALVLAARRPGARAPVVRDILLFVLSLGAVFALLYAVHRSSLAPSALADSVGYVQRSGSKTVRLNEFFPRYREFAESFRWNAIVWISLALAVGLLAARLRRPTRDRRAVLLLALLLPLLSLLVYRNAFPYFYVLLMPPAVIVCGVPFQRLLDEARAAVPRARSALALALGGLALSFGTKFAGRATDHTWAQRQIVETVHRMFPGPVPYIDRNSMIPSFPKVGFFMSTWGLENYRDTGRPIFPTLLREAAPVFLLVNSPALDPSADSASASWGGHRLFDEDRRVLRENFVPHWGPIYVAGKRVDLPAGGVREIDVLIPGTYTVEATGRVAIDGVPYRVGEPVSLARGAHRITSLSGPQTATLRWGAHLYRPAGRPPEAPVYDPW